MRIRCKKFVALRKTPMEERKNQTPEQKEQARLRAIKYFEENKFEVNRKNAIKRLVAGQKVSSKVLEKYGIDPTKVVKQETVHNDTISQIRPPPCAYLWIPIPIPLNQTLSA